MKLPKIIFSAVLFTVILIIAAGLFAQDTGGKRIMTIEDYARWRSIGSTSISDDGSWITYAYGTPEADDTLYVKSMETGSEYVIPGGSNPKFSDDAGWVAYVVNLPVKEAKELRKKKKPVPLTVKLLNLRTGEKYTWQNAAAPPPPPRRGRRPAVDTAPKIISFDFTKGSGFFAVKKAQIDTSVRHKGTDVILKNLKSGLDMLIGSASEGGFNKPGEIFAYTVDAADKNANGLYVLHLNSGVHRTLDSDTLTYAQLTWDKEGTALAVLKGEKRPGFKQKDNILTAFTEFGNGEPQRFEYNPAGSEDFPENMVISENGTLTWRKDLSAVFLGIKEQEKEPEKKKNAKPVANVDVWHWKDERIQSVQMAQAKADRNFTYRSVFLLQKNRFVRLTDERMRTISITEDGNWGIGRDDKGYISDWKERKADYYRVNVDTGERTLVVKGQIYTHGLSPDSRHFLMWRDGHMWDYNIISGNMINLTENAPVNFVDAEYDHPGTRPAYGVTGWTKDGKNVILRHRYDLWLQPLDGSAARCLTNGAGAKDEIRFRYVQTDPEEKFVDLSKPVLLSAFGQWTKLAGFYRLENGKIDKLVYDKKSFGVPKKAKNADRFMYTVECFDEFPDYHVAGSDFRNPEKVTDANPWLPEYKWGHNILIDYTNSNGIRLQGVLMIPEDYSPGDKYPMLVDFYEKNSHNLYRYSRLVFRDTPMFYKYVSNGYLVLLPDVHFNTRTTHSDMLECVEAAVSKVIELGYADPARIGLHGHSFSGGGASFISTRSKMFAAIVAGAAPINLVSEFNILFRGSGQNNHRYDIYGQGRYGANPYDDFELFRDQSPITHVRTMDTPLLYLHGTSDGSVEYLQGMEFYNALRFNGKNVIFLSYPGQGHHATKLENKKDFQTSMEQFYDHYLKDKPAPDWMINGVPFLKKKK